MLRWTQMLVCSLAVSLAAQSTTKKPLNRRSFYPSEHSLAAFIDVAALQDTDAWSSFERSPARMLLERFRRLSGFDVTEIDRLDIRMSSRSDADNKRGRASFVVALTGTESVNVEKIDLDKLSPRYSFKTLGDHQVILGREPAMISPRKGLMIYTNTHHLNAVLLDQLKSTVPTPGLKPLMAGPEAIAWFAVIRPAGEPYSHAFNLPHSMQTETDPWTSFASRITLNKETDHFELAAQVGFAQGNKGPAVFQDGFAQMAKKLVSSAVGKQLAPLFAAISFEHRGKTLGLSLDLGPERRFAGILTSLTVFFASEVLGRNKVEAIDASVQVKVRPAKPAAKGSKKN